MPSLAKRSMFGISSTGIREFASEVSIAIAVPFHAQSSMKSNTMFGLVESFGSAHAHWHAKKVAKTDIDSVVVLLKLVGFMLGKSVGCKVSRRASSLRFLDCVEYFAVDDQFHKISEPAFSFCKLRHDRVNCWPVSEAEFSTKCINQHLLR